MSASKKSRGRMIRLPQTVLIFVIVFATSSATHATEPPPWQLELSLFTGAAVGIMGEYVYSGSNTLSYLDWQLMPLVTLGAGVETTAPWGTIMGARAALPLTRVTGTMTNSDYENPNAPLERTKVSYHTAIVDTYRDLDVWLLQRLASDRSGSVALGVGYQDRFVKMIAQDGSYDYGTSSGTVTGVSITYEQHQRIPYVTLVAESHGKPRLNAGVSFAPYIFVDALDHHHRRLLDFHDTVRGSVWAGADIGASLELAGRAVQITAFGELIPETKGDTYTVGYTTNSFSGTTSPTLTDGAGVSWWAAGLRISLPAD